MESLKCTWIQVTSISNHPGIVALVLAVQEEDGKFNHSTCAALRDGAAQLYLSNRNKEH